MACPTRPELIKAVGDYAEAYSHEEKSPTKTKERVRLEAGQRLTELLDRLYGRLDVLERDAANTVPFPQP